MINGSLFKYGASQYQIAFVTSPHNLTKNVFILIPGVTEGMGSLPWTQVLSEHLQDTTSIIMPNLESSWCQFGVSSLDHDSQDLQQLVLFLTTTYQPKNFIFMGHSTGAQIVIRYMQNFGKGLLFKPAIILHSGISDREYLSASKGVEFVTTAVQKSLAFINNGKPKTIVPDCTIFNTIVNAESLLKRLGDDDMFSTDLTEDELTKIFRCLEHAQSILLFYGLDDEYIPDKIHFNEFIYSKLLPVLNRCIIDNKSIHPSSDKVTLTFLKANHSTSKKYPEAITHMVTTITEYINKNIF